MKTNRKPTPENATSRTEAESIRGTIAEVAFSDLPLVSTKQQLAAILHVSPKHVENLTARGLLRPVRLGRCVRYRRDAVMHALRQMEGTAA